MRKLLNVREWIGTGIQLCIFALLLPFMALFLGMIMDTAPAAKNEYISAVISSLPFADPIQNTITGLDIANPSISMMRYAYALLETIEGNLMAAVYVGTWLYSFRLIFKEILGPFLRLYGIPILQTVCGLFFSAITFAMLHDPVMFYMATAFMIVLDIVLTILCVAKPLWKKLLDILGFFMQSYLAAITIGYVTSLILAMQGYFSNMTQGIVCLAVPTLLLVIYLLAQYLIVER